MDGLMALPVVGKLFRKIHHFLHLCHLSIVYVSQKKFLAEKQWIKEHFCLLKL